MCAGNLGVDGRLPGLVAGRLPDLYAQAEAARRQSVLLAGQLQASRRRAQENWQLIQAAWNRAHQIRAVRLAARTDQGRLRYSAYSRTQAKLASMPLIEQAKGIIMAQRGWSEDQAFDALRRASQRENVKVRDLAARIVAATVHAAPDQRQAGQAPAMARSRDGSSSFEGLGSSRDGHRASA